MHFHKIGEIPKFYGADILDTQLSHFAASLSNTGLSELMKVKVMRAHLLSLVLDLPLSW